MYRLKKSCKLIMFLSLFLIASFCITQVQHKGQTTSLQSSLMSKFNADLSNIAKSFRQGQTSQAFSYAIKLHYQISVLEKQLQIGHPLKSQYVQFQKLTQNQNACQAKLSQIVSIIETIQDEKLQQITDRLEFLQSSCTNRDFEYNQFKKDNGKDPTKCAVCVVLVQILRNYVAVHASDISYFVQKQLCQHFQGALQPTCEAFVHYAGPQLIKTLANKQTADVSCLKIGFCYNPNCKIASQTARQLQFQQFSDSKPAPWDWLVHLFVDKFGNGHFSPFDLDNDGFSDISTFRGYNWRGVDCDQLSNKIYPGRKTHSNQILDYDCNGIYGLQSLSKSYEEKLCKQQNTGSKRLGVAVIGDSAGAHFSIPASYMNASIIGKGTYKDILIRIADQFDMPYYSAYTGHRNSSQKPNEQKTHSVYKHLRKWNMCNNNDYQNIAVNGGQSKNTQDNIKALKRSQKDDYPLLVFLQLVGNDVCMHSFNQMTTPQQFKVNILKLLNHLDQQLPANSHLVMFGLADGDLLFKYLHNITHPLGVTYANVYDFLNCLQISPCWGWLNTNATVRQFATERAKNLSNVYKEIIKSGVVFKNFDMQYYDFPTVEIMNQYIVDGGNPVDLIEKCDGFHPNTEFNSRFGDWIWSKIQQDHPEWIGKENPFNEEIKRVFGLHTIQ